MSGCTLAGPATHGCEIRHSRFLAHAAPVADADAALAWIAATGDPAATHNCWAYRIGTAYRSGDDGEPAGTAGRPILAAIDGQGLDRVAVVVVRWYGGVKLGAGGLARAYGGAAAQCLRAAARLPIVDLVDAVLAFPYADTGAVHALLSSPGVERMEEAFGAGGGRLRIRLPADALDGLKTRLRDATRDRATVSAG